MCFMILPYYLFSIYLFCIVIDYKNDNFEVISNLHVQGSKFGGKSLKKVELHGVHGVCFFQVCFRKTNTDPSIHFRKANTDPSVHIRKANTEFLLPVLLPTPNFTSKFTPSFISNININLLHHDECNIISQITVN